MDRGVGGTRGRDGALLRPAAAPAVGRSAPDGASDGRSWSGGAGAGPVPESLGPALESYRAPDRRPPTVAAIVAMAAVALYAGWSMTSLAVAVAVAGTAAIVVVSLVAPARVDAGARWLATRRAWVDLDDLSVIRVQDAAVGRRPLPSLLASVVQDRPPRQDLVLTDRAGRTVRVDLQVVQGNPALWDRTYAHLCRAARNGADVDWHASAVLLLED